jgi:hypothetical protein
MQTITITIRINRSVRDVFAFTTTPPNSTLWISSFAKEATSEWPIRVGTIYKLENQQGERSEYTVTALKENELFELVSADNNYHVRYTYRSVDDNSSELAYYEWVDQGELEEPFTAETLEKLKYILENSSR